MKHAPPQFALNRVTDTNAEASPALIPLTAQPMERRKFLGAGLSAAAALLFLDGCASGPTTSEYVLPDGAPGASPNVSPTPRAALDPSCATAPKSSLRAFKRSGSIILSVSADGQLISWSNRAERKTWSWQEGELQSKDKGTPASSSDCQGAVTPDGKLRATAKGAVIEVWSVADSRLLGTLKGHAGTVSCLVVTPDGKTLISADSNGAILIWDLDPPCFRSFLFDPQDNEPKTKGITYTRQDKVTGRTIRYTLPCGSPIPPGATCICNCVPGSYVAPVAATPKPKPKPKPKPRPRRGGGRSGTVPCGSAIPPGAICTCDCMY